MKYQTYLCGDTDCSRDAAFEHRFYFGCVPRDFNERSGRSKTYRQAKAADGKWRWNGGCDVAAVDGEHG